jgi:hypothetical protein
MIHIDGLEGRKKRPRGVQATPLHPSTACSPRRAQLELTDVEGGHRLQQRQEAGAAAAAARPPAVREGTAQHTAHPLLWYPISYGILRTAVVVHAP